MPYQGPDGSMHRSRAARTPTKKPYPEPTQELVQGSFDWGDVDGRLLAGALGCVTARGDAMSYAANRSRTQGSITILSGADRPRYTFASVQAAEEWLQAVMDI